MLGSIKAAGVRALESTGAFRAIANTNWRRQRLLVLCYHGISLHDEHEWNNGLFLSPARFEARMQMLADLGYRVLPLDEALSRLASRSLPPRSVVITFDDGFSDFRFQAWPILQHFGFPATLYLTTHYVFHRCALFNLVVPYILWRCRDRQPEPNPSLGWTTSQDLTSPAGRHLAWQPLIRLSLERQLTTEGKEELVYQLAHHLGFDYATLRKQRLLELLQPDEVVALSRSGLDVQLHTHRHRTPDRMDRFEKELRDNSARIEELTGRIPRHFCYPSGVQKSGMDAAFRSTGILSATTCATGLATPATDPFRVPRFLDAEHVENVTVDSWLSGIAEFLPNRMGDGMGDEFPYIDRLDAKDHP